jgi:hypothetical protein
VGRQLLAQRELDVGAGRCSMARST